MSRECREYLGYQESARPPAGGSQGLRSRTPVPATSALLRVTNVKPATMAVAACRPPMTGSERPALSRPHSSATSRGYRQYAVGVALAQRSQPGVIPARSNWVARMEPLDAPPDLTDHQHTEKEIVAPSRCHPGTDARIPRWLACLGNDVRVEQITHRSTARVWSALR